VAGGPDCGFHLEVDRIEGKWKLNQNHPVERRERVVRALRQRSDDNAQAIAALMQAMLATERGSQADPSCRASGKED
jgi:hypothetical protein